MKTIVLVRHAKSDWSIEGLNDIDRPLNLRGYTDAHKIGERLKDKFPGKVQFKSSPAIRAISTALIIAREINYPQQNISIHPELYEAELNVYENIILSSENNFDTIFIFGHNPTISYVIGKISNTPVVDISTCSVSVIKVQTDDWTDALTSKSTLELQLFPKLLSS